MGENIESSKLVVTDKRRIFLEETDKSRENIVALGFGARASIFSKCARIEKERDARLLSEM